MSGAEQAGEKVVLARKSHEHLIRTRDRALREVEYAREEVESTRLWAHQAFAEQRRLQDRLTAVVAAAASLGVSIDAINKALGNPECGECISSPGVSS